ncbi:hypothetical protein M422DRAFT_33041 [Sphaerobolus stellatus SS14]|nr:hypothetical protein M422DRAFT_33041 [Sphaerobolus stellatus SS14]
MHGTGEPYAMTPPSEHVFSLPSSASDTPQHCLDEDHLIAILGHDTSNNICVRRQ